MEYCELIPLAPVYLQRCAEFQSRMALVRHIKGTESEGLSNYWIRTLGALASIQSNPTCWHRGVRPFPVLDVSIDYENNVTSILTPVPHWNRIQLEHASDRLDPSMQRHLNGEASDGFGGSEGQDTRYGSWCDLEAFTAAGLLQYCSPDSKVYVVHTLLQTMNAMLSRKVCHPALSLRSVLLQIACSSKEIGTVAAAGAVLNEIKIEAVVVAFPPALPWPTPRILDSMTPLQYCYQAPETLIGAVSLADASVAELPSVWAAGCVALTLLLNRPPFCPRPSRCDGAGGEPAPASSSVDASSASALAQHVMAAVLATLGVPRTGIWPHVCALQEMQSCRHVCDLEAARLLQPPPGIAQYSGVPPMSEAPARATACPIDDGSLAAFVRIALAVDFDDRIPIVAALRLCCFQAFSAPSSSCSPRHLAQSGSREDLIGMATAPNGSLRGSSCLENDIRAAHAIAPVSASAAYMRDGSPSGSQYDEF
eukprot:GHVU01052391.1.p1 GENE.GHVU01052391.1~~GHVU01052391.1.p1  ORF type:complete len:481 (+),score=35.40 GHVU01052391.1:70-1512(+)